MVALLTECVDRNIGTMIEEKLLSLVALLTECVDRNIRPYIANNVALVVALLTECVDRNVVGDMPNVEAYSRTPYGVRG